MAMVMDRTAMIEKLNEILRWEYAGMVQYTQFSFVVRGPLREVYHKFFRENGEEALGHAQRVGDKIVSLGGVTQVDRAEVKQSLELDEMLEHSLAVERKHVQLYTEALDMVGPHDIGLRTMLEEICTEEQEGADNLEKILMKRELVTSSQPRSQQQIA